MTNTPSGSRGQLGGHWGSPAGGLDPTPGWAGGQKWAGPGFGKGD